MSCIYNVNMGKLQFEWDERKNLLNQKKHGVSFEEARTVFYDDNAVEFFDSDYSVMEERFLMLGLSVKSRILLVCYCLRGKGSSIRIVSARKATKRERSFYPGVN